MWRIVCRFVKCIDIDKYRYLIFIYILYHHSVDTIDICVISTESRYIYCGPVYGWLPVPWVTMQVFYPYCVDIIDVQMCRYIYSGDQRPGLRCRCYKHTQVATQSTGATSQLLLHHTATVITPTADTRQQPGCQQTGGLSVVWVCVISK